MPQARLTAADREFFAALPDVVFGNPFTPQRAELILRLVPGASLGDLTRDREALPRVVAPRLQRLQDQHLGEEERRLLEAALWYVCYHRAVPQLDALIEQQAKQAGAALAVTFADDVIAELLRGGLSEERVLRIFAFFFQLRRAFYFIERSLAGECESMRRLREALWNNVFTHDMRGYEAGLWNRMEDFSTLLLGETGTGKGSAAAAIGRSEFIPYAARRPREKAFLRPRDRGNQPATGRPAPRRAVPRRLFLPAVLGCDRGSDAAPADRGIPRRAAPTGAADGRAHHRYRVERAGRRGPGSPRGKPAARLSLARECARARAGRAARGAHRAVCGRPRPRGAGRRGVVDRKAARRRAHRRAAAIALLRPALPAPGHLCRGREAHRARSAHLAQVRRRRKRWIAASMRRRSW